MVYIKRYNNQTEGLFIIDEQEFIRFSIVIAEENAAAAFDIVTEVLRAIDKQSEGNNMILSVELLANLSPVGFKKLELLLLDPEENFKRIAISLKNGRHNTMEMMPSLMSMDKETFHDFKIRFAEGNVDVLADRIRMIERIRMFDEEEVIQSYVG